MPLAVKDETKDEKSQKEGAQSRPAPPPAPPFSEDKLLLKRDKETKALESLQRIYVKQNLKFAPSEAKAHMILDGTLNTVGDKLMFTAGTVEMPDRSVERDADGKPVMLSFKDTFTTPGLPLNRNWSLAVNSDGSIDATNTENSKTLQTIRESLGVNQLQRFAAVREAKDQEERDRLGAKPEMTHYGSPDQLSNDKKSRAVSIKVKMLNKDGQVCTVLCSGVLTNFKDPWLGMGSSSGDLVINDIRKLENGKPVGDSLLKQEFRVREVTVSKGEHELDYNALAGHVGFKDEMKLRLPVLERPASVPAAGDKKHGYLVPKNTPAVARGPVTGRSGEDYTV